MVCGFEILKFEGIIWERNEALTESIFDVKNADISILFVLLFFKIYSLIIAMLKKR